MTMARFVLPTGAFLWLAVVALLADRLNAAMGFSLFAVAILVWGATADPSDEPDEE